MVRTLAPALLAMALVGFTRGAAAAPVVFLADLSGPAESPPNASPGTGFAEVDFDIVAHTMRVQMSFTGLLGTTTASHIHSATPIPDTGTAGVATQTPTFSSFPLGVTSGTYDQTFYTSLASTYNPAFVTNHGGSVTASEVALLAGLEAGEAYLNIHTSVVPGGEIRGFLHAVPEPSAFALAGIGGLALLGYARRRRAHA